MIAHLIQSVLRILPPQAAHRLLLNNLDWMTVFNLHREFLQSRPEISRTVMGIRFPNCIGLAAGFDQNGTCITPLGAFGFGHIEIGSVTPKPQSTPYPMRRNVSRQSISYPTDCNSEGIDAVLRHIGHSAPGFRVRGGIVGLNIGALSADTATDDFCDVLRKGYAHADYFVLNLATPLQASIQPQDTVKRWLKAVDAERSRIIERAPLERKPIAVKLAAGLPEDDLRRLLDVIVETHMDGIIAFGSQATRRGAQNPVLVSGAPIAELCIADLTRVVEHLKGRLPVIASGGLTDASSVSHAAQAGADLIQIHSGFVFRGPGFVADAINAFEEHSLEFHNVKR